MDRAADGGFLEYKQRVVYSLLRAAARVGLRLRVDLGAMTALLQMAVFQEAREQQDLKLDAIAELFGKSLRTVSTLHRKFRTDFFAPETETALRRAIAALVNYAPADETRLRAAFPDVQPVAMEAALDDLVREGTLLRDGPLWRRNANAHEFVGADPKQRIDGLNRQMDVFAATVWSRFIEGSDAGLARTYVFRTTDADWDALKDAVQALIRDRAIAADEATHGAGRRVGLTLAGAPLEEER